MTTDATLPDWPPPPDEPIGIDRARAYIAWIRQHVRPLLDEAERLLRARYPYEEISRSSVRVEQLATWALSDRQAGLSIGTISTKAPGGTFAMVDIIIQRDGTLAVRPGMNMR
jgi:hypothetical protein